MIFRKNVKKVGSNQHEVKARFLRSGTWKSIFYLVSLGAAYALGGVFFTHYQVQSPIVITTQDMFVPVKTEKLISPVSTRSASFIEKVYVEELEIDPATVDMFDTAAVKEYVKQESLKKWGVKEWEALEELIRRESNFRVVAQNPTSTAFGIFQFLDATWGNYDCKKTTDLKEQVECGIKYVSIRYGSPIEAKAFWDLKNWY